ncbi:MAG: chitobiase/beta-hexosaminidase C-terminal domain-containing protein, partial [Phycisphaerae bacterium]|nr:chitobiase/beta-hexosaminidase C-terminal domain-containing protein [Phycisphaerae bacterium]
KGQLAVQFDMDDHLIVYSPRLATVRSFLKDHVHALTVNGDREQLNAKRPLAEADRQLLGQIDWPDAPPDDGLKPAYTTEQWDKPPRLMVWAEPGTSGRFSQPGNWLVNGSVATTLSSTEVWTGPSWGRDRGVTDLDKDTDILIPAAPGDYQVRGRRGTYLARHITVEANAFFGHGIEGAYGNLWVGASGRLDGGGHASLRGAKHTFFVNGRRREPGQPVDWKAIDAKGFARKWMLRKDDPDATKEFIGSVRSGDETHIVRGRGIVSENSSVLIGARCCQSVRPEATLQLTSGAVLAKHSNQLHKQDMLVAGTLLAGTPDRPLQSDCHIGISFKDHEAVFAGRMWREVGEQRGFIGFEIVPGAKVRVHSVDPTRARLVFACHQKEGAGDSGDVPDKQSDPEKWRIYENLPRRINMVIWKDADVQFNGVVFSDVERHGIKLEDMSMKDTWRNVFYGDNNAAPPQALYVQHTPTLEGRGNYSYPIETVVKGQDVGGDTAFVKRAGTPIIDTPGGWYPKGRPVRVSLSTENEELQIRYTLDGKQPTADSALYEGPITVRHESVLKAASFSDDERRGEIAEARYEFVSSRDVRILPATHHGATRPGLAYKYYEGDWKQLPDFDSLEPSRQGVAPELNLDALDMRGNDFAVVLEGFIEVSETGAYSFYASTGKEDACRVSIDGQRVIDSDMQTMENAGLVGLEAGRHKLRIEFMDGGWGQYIRLALRPLDSTQKQTVTTDMLSH